MNMIILLYTSLLPNIRSIHIVTINVTSYIKMNRDASDIPKFDENQFYDLHSDCFALLILEK
jgi:hypothetical protein